MICIPTQERGNETGYSVQAMICIPMQERGNETGHWGGSSERGNESERV